MIALAREGVLYQVGDRTGIEALRRHIHRDNCACRGAIETCRALGEQVAA